MSCKWKKKAVGSDRARRPRATNRSLRGAAAATGVARQTRTPLATELLEDSISHGRAWGVRSSLRRNPRRNAAVRGPARDEGDIRLGESCRVVCFFTASAGPASLESPSRFLPPLEGTR